MERLWQPVLQVVHGYLSVDPPDEARVADWTRDIADFSTKAGYSLGSIFIDRDMSSGRSARDGFIELLAALCQPKAYAVVVPSLMHLSTDSFMQQVLVQLVRLTDSHVLVCDTRDTTSSAVTYVPRAAS